MAVCSEKETSQKKGVSGKQPLPGEPVVEAVSVPGVEQGGGTTRLHNLFTPELYHRHFEV